MEDWVEDDFVLPIINSKEQMKRLEERKLIEESNNKLIEDLFSIEQMNLPDVKQEPPKPSKILQSPPIKNKFNSNIQKNEMKLKETSKKIKEEKEKRKRDIEIYGDNDYEYCNYEDKFYNN